MANKFLIIVLLAFVIYFTSTAAVVKIMDSETPYLNQEYIGNKTVIENVVKVNETYNKLPLYLVVEKDWPLDTILTTQVYKRNKCGEYQLVNVYNTSICDHADPLYPHLPTFLLILTAGCVDECVKKGEYYFVDGGQFDFSNVEPEKYCEDESEFMSKNRIFSPSAGCDISRVIIYSKNC